MEAKELLVGVFTKTLNKTPEEISELLYQTAEGSDEVTLKDDAIDLVLDHDATRISNVKKSTKPNEKALKDQYLKGFKEGKAELEGEMKQHSGLESDALGSDLVKEVVTHLSDCNVPSEDQIKAHPLFVALEKNRVPKEDYDKLHKEHEDFKTNQDKTQRLASVKRDVLTIFAGLKPIVSENQTVAQTRQKDFLTKFEAYDYDVAEDGNHLVKQNGSRMEDKHGNPIKFADFVKDVAMLNYDFQVGDDRGNAGNTNDGVQTNSRIEVPTDEKDYHARLAALWAVGDKAGGIALTKVWEASKNK